MEDFKNYFRDKKITVVGLGLLGRSIGDIKFMSEQGANLTVTDLKTEEELASSLEQLKTFDISYSLGGHKMEDFQPENCDLVIKAAGIPLNSPFIEEAKKNNIPVKMSTSLFAEMYPGVIIGVTGTRGKSTVAAMIYKILRDAGLKTFLGGNIRGVSTLAHLAESNVDEFAVLELDSWQLQGFGEAQISPHISVFTTFFPDHLNYYNNDLDLYMEDKSNIFKFQGVEDFLILGDQVSTTILSKYENEIKSKVSIIKTENWPAPPAGGLQMKVLGEHNKYNASLAAKVGEIIGIDEKKIRESLENFEAVEGRLQFVKEIKGIKVFNDNNATTPNATIAALKALSKELGEKINLIIGGSDKDLDTKILADMISELASSVVFLPGTGTEKLKANLDLEKLKFSDSNSINEAIGLSLGFAENLGGIILFSPAFASFGPPPGGFKNEYDRGDQFLEILKNID